MFSAPHASPKQGIIIALMVVRPISGHTAKISVTLS